MKRYLYCLKTKSHMAMLTSGLRGRPSPSFRMPSSQPRTGSLFLVRFSLHASPSSCFAFLPPATAPAVHSLDFSRTLHLFLFCVLPLFGITCYAPIFRHIIDSLLHFSGSCLGGQFAKSNFVVARFLRALSQGSINATFN